MRIVTLLLIGLLAHSAAWAQRPSRAPDEYRMSRDDAVSMARQRVPGRVLSAQTRTQNGNNAHQIRILTPDGIVRRLNIDADSGEFIRPRRSPQRPGPDNRRKSRRYNR